MTEKKMDETLDYFELLGVDEDVGRDELEARYQELADHLASPAIPAHLQEWARRQAALVDEAYAVLSDPERRTAVRREQQALDGQTGDDGDDVRQSPEPDAEVQEELREKEESQARTGRASPRPTPALNLRPVLVGVLLGLVVLGTLLLGRYGLPRNEAGNATKPQEEISVLAPLDTERVTELMAAVEENPNDPEVLFDLGETYFQANEWQLASDWFTRLLALDPENVHARTDVGTANFNLGNLEEAEAAWLAVLEIDPDDVQAHYNLGFVYANAEPQDIASARQEWEIVVNLAPDSELASIAKAHLDGLSEAVEEATGEEVSGSPSDEAGGAGEAD